jgi:hypothetical protein
MTKETKIYTALLLIVAFILLGSLSITTIEEPKEVMIIKADFWQKLCDIEEKLDRNYKVIKWSLYYNVMCLGCPMPGFRELQLLIDDMAEAAKLEIENERVH